MFPAIGSYYAFLGLLFQTALIVFAIRTYRARRTRVTQLLMWATICYVVAASSWFTFYFVTGLLWGQHPTSGMRCAVARCRYYSDQTFQILFAALMIAAFIALVRGRFSDDSTST